MDTFLSWGQRSCSFAKLDQKLWWPRWARPSRTAASVKLLVHEVRKASAARSTAVRHFAAHRKNTICLTSIVLRSASVTARLTTPVAYHLLSVGVGWTWISLEALLGRLLSHALHLVVLYKLLLPDRRCEHRSPQEVSDSNSGRMLLLPRALQAAATWSLSWRTVASVSGSLSLFCSCSHTWPELHRANEPKAQAEWLALRAPTLQHRGFSS